VSRPLVAVAAVVVVLGAAVGIGEATRPAAVSAAGTAAVAPVIGAVRSCPPVAAPSTSVMPRIALGAPPADPAAAGVPGPVPPGSVTVGPLGAASSGSSILDRAGTVVPAVPLPAGSDGLVVRAQGAPAAGLEVESLTRGDSGLDRGLSELRCSEPATDRWFTGPSTVVGLSSTLELANPGDVPALADVELAGPKGLIDTGRARKITVAPRARLTIPLETLAPDEDVLTVHVAASSGRLVSAVRQVRGAADAPLGVDWIPPSADPAKIAVLPGLPAGPGERILVVGNTGPDDTVVSVQLVTADGEFVPTGLAAIPVGARTPRLVALSTQLAASGAAVRIVSETSPIVVSAFLDTSSSDRVIHEFGWVGAGRPLTGRTLIADVGGSETTTSTLFLSAPDGPATVTLTPVPGTGQPPAGGPPVVVSVPAGRLVSVAAADVVEATGQQALVVSVSPGSGPVYAGRWKFERGARGPLVAYLQLESAPAVVPVPRVRADLAASLPR